MDLVDEQHVVGLEVGQQRRQIARPLEHGTGGLPQIHAHLARDDVRQRGLAQARRPEQQDVVERLAPVAGGLDEDGELRADLLLADVVAELLGPQRPLQRFFLDGGALGGDQAVGLDHGFDPLNPRTAKAQRRKETPRKGKRNR